MTARAFGLVLSVLLPMTASAQRVLTLDSCRAMALRNNKQMGVAKVKQEVNANLRQSARTQYLPKVNAVGTYQHVSKSISLLNDEQKTSLPQMGTAVGAGLKQNMAGTLSQLPPQTIQALGQMGLTPEVISSMSGQQIDGLANALNGVGQGLVDALDIDTRNIWAGGITVTQPVFMGGAIVAANKMADINEEMAANALEAKQQTTLFNIDHAATKGDGLSVGVRVNEAEIALMEAEDGLALSKMLLCQLCGLPVDEEIVLADENSESLPTALSVPDAQNYDNRPELKLLQNTVDLSRQTTNVLKAGNLPQVLLTGGYAVTNPNTFNGFEKKFGGFWNVGVLVRIPVWNWGDVKYKVRASKGATTMANLELAEARETIELQVNQSRFRVNEAYKKLEMAQANVANADENLRMANLGFKEGTVSFTTVMEAQTAWQLAQTKKIDAEIGVRLRQVELQKALGTLTAN